MLLAIEGIDGAGKSTLIAGLVERLGHGGSVMVERLAPVMVDVFKSVTDDVTGIEGNYQNVFPPALRHESYIVEALVQMRTKAPIYAEYDFVIFDRWTGTNLVYLDPPEMHSAHWKRLLGLLPRIEYYFWLRTPPAIALDRLSERNDWMPRNIVRHELLGALTEWDLGFEALATAEEMIILDGSLPATRVLEECISRIANTERRLRALG